MVDSTLLSKQKSFKRWVKKVTTRKINPATPLSRHAQGQGQGVFGVPLVVSTSYARGTVKYQDMDENNHEHAAAIPLVVTKCGSYLKSQGLITDGIFRISGNAKRVNNLQYIFDSPVDSYGLHHIWEGYTVHDATTLLRRFFLSLPDPVIPASFYQPFRNVIDDSTDDETSQRIDAFQNLICQLPTAHQHLLFYVLDLLHFFAINDSTTRMDASNLAAIFSPGLLDRPLPGQQLAAYDSTSTRVVAFLIQHQPLFTMDLLVKNETHLMDLDEALVSPNIYHRFFTPSSSHTTSTISSVKSHQSSISPSPSQSHEEIRNLGYSQHMGSTPLPPPPQSSSLSFSIHKLMDQPHYHSVITAQWKDRLHYTLDWIIRQLNAWWLHIHPLPLLGWYLTLGIIALVAAYEGHLILDEIAIMEPCLFFGGLACFLCLFIFGITPTTKSQDTLDDSNEVAGFETYHVSHYSYGDGTKTQHIKQNKSIE